MSPELVAECSGIRNRANEEQQIGIVALSREMTELNDKIKNTAADFLDCLKRLPSRTQQGAYRGHKTGIHTGGTIWFRKDTDNLTE